MPAAHGWICLSVRRSRPSWDFAATLRAQCMLRVQQLTTLDSYCTLGFVRTDAIQWQFWSVLRPVFKICLPKKITPLLNGSCVDITGYNHWETFSPLLVTCSQVKLFLIASIVSPLAMTLVDAIRLSFLTLLFLLRPVEFHQNKHHELVIFSTQHFFLWAGFCISISSQANWKEPDC